MSKHFRTRLSAVSSSQYFLNRARAVASSWKSARATGVADERAKIIAQIMISLLALGAGIYLLGWADCSEAIKQVVAGWIGLIIGYWIS